MHGDLHRHLSAALDDRLVRDLALTQRAGARHWQAARLRARGLDVRIARGVPPESDKALAARAARLTRRSARRELARRIERLAHDARDAGALAEELQLLARRLVAPAPVAARGVARAHLLLSDHWRPLYPGRSTDVLRTVVARAIDALDGQLDQDRR
jgi:hypothetical protein